LHHFNRPVARHVPRAERWFATEPKSLRTVPPEARRWIALSTSLTAQLAAHLEGEVRVRVLSERHDRFLTSEREVLDTLDRAGRVREVRLEVHGMPYVVARTVFPASTARGANRALLHLGTRALGSLLFSAMRAPANLRQYTRLRPTSSLWRTLHVHLPEDVGGLWARRALHRLHGQPLLVTEVFLPHLFATNTPSRDAPPAD
jgi:chorismate--pyruvate lyase